MDKFDNLNKDQDKRFNETEFVEQLTIFKKKFDPELAQLKNSENYKLLQFEIRTIESKISDLIDVYKRDHFNHVTQWIHIFDTIPPSLREYEAQLFDVMVPMSTKMYLADLVQQIKDLQKSLTRLQEYNNSIFSSSLEKN